MQKNSHAIVLTAFLVFALSAPMRLAAQTLKQLNEETITKFDKVVESGQIPQELQALFTQLDDKNEVLRIKTVQALSLVGGPMAALLLRRAIDDDVERAAAVRSEAAKGLGDIGGRQALETLGIGITDRNVTVRLNTVEALRWAGTVFAVPFIQEALRNDKALDVRLKAVHMLRKIGTQFSTQPLQEALMEDPDLGLRLAAADALGEIGKKERQVASLLGEALNIEKDSSVRLEIVKSLGLVRERAGLPFLAIAMANDKNLTVRMRATEIYGRVLGLQ
ncbi:MAG: HEAT repeat domain-containing protein [Candidatus Latescibacterota bacterium]|nr:HEAT repeat domain-containing protein [Candidatus Latescibacterota bacterium]